MIYPLLNSNAEAHSAASTLQISLCYNYSVFNGISEFAQYIKDNIKEGFSLEFKFNFHHHHHGHYGLS